MQLVRNNKAVAVYLTLIFILLFSTHIFSQKLSTQSKKAEVLYNKALSLYRSGKFENAKDPLNQAIKKDPNFIEAYLLKSELFYEQKDYHKQIESLRNVIELDSTFFVFTYKSMGEAHFYIKEYDEAIHWFKKYLTKISDSKKKDEVQKWIEKASFSKSAFKAPKSIKAENLGPNVNSIYNEYWPSITADEQTLVYTVLVARDSAINNGGHPMRLANHYHEDFFRAIKDESGEWQKREQLRAPLNTLSNEGAQTLSSDGNWMFFTACGRSDSKGSCDIYFSYRTRSGWSSPKNIGAPVNTPYWESQPCFSSDGRTLYYTSNRVGGLGKNDIWRATIIDIKPDGTPYFSKPENLGDRINTPLDEVSAFIHPDNSTLYFASEGWPGLGKADLFMSKITNGKFESEPKNLGYPINTEGDEVGLVVTASGKKAFFSSERYGDSYGGRDLYSFDLPQDLRPLPVSYVKGRVFDARTRERLKATFELNDLENGELVVQAVSNDFTGEFLVCLPYSSSYALNVSKKGYLFYSDHFEMDTSSTIRDPQVLDIYLKPIREGEHIILKNIFYATDSYELKPRSEIELYKVISFLNDNASTKIEIIGYTDNVGTESYNLELSKKRAQQVFEYLIQKGISNTRISYSGKGMKDPVADNQTETGRAQNRRTEMKIIQY